MTGAPELFEYGIQVENSDVRAHVSVVNKTVYVFPTANGIRAIERYDPPLRTATQPGVVGPTAEGWLVRCEWIDDLRRLRFFSWERWPQFAETLSTTGKGTLAVECVLATMQMGKFPFWIDATESDRENVQLGGTDILVFCRKKVQVKCDYRSGEKPLGTGNLFLQRAERNPLGKH